jgi:uncharacterized alkaline shock family protein YloU
MADSAESSAKPADSDSSSAVSQSGAAELTTDAGITSIAESVVAKIAGVAAREISGVHAMGTGRTRAAGAIRQRIGATTAAQGVSVDVGRRQAAVDLDVIVDYGVSIPDLSAAIRQNVISRVEALSGLEVTEVNISIDDVWLGESEQDEPRVE